MSKTLIAHSDVEDRALRTALSELAGQRNLALHRLRAMLGADSRVRAAWLWGSFLRGEADDLSDLDIWILVPRPYVPEMGAVFARWCEELGTVVSAGESPTNVPAGGGHYSAILAGARGLIHLDLYWQAVEQAEIPDAPLLVDRLAEEAQGLPVPTAPPPYIMEPENVAADCRDRLAFVWLMLSVAAKYLARDPESDLSLMRHARRAFEDCVELLDIAEDVGELEWSTPASPVQKVDRLRQVARSSTMIERAIRNRGVEVSYDAYHSLRVYFDLIEAIVTHSARDR